MGGPGAAAFRKGFGSIKVTAEIAGHMWQTSVFPDSTSGSKSGATVSHPARPAPRPASAPVRGRR
ncbi:DUF1905 domain-containing protein [[Micrococcus luteus] ATCC 49442]|uniref:DUF1905 domain-containing protein n=1 Tax=[Micrococcus luteus] ATCC 49442 TaxID=2698727 RepID=UPI0013DC9CBF